MEGRRVYLDNAATSWPKSETVLQAAEHFSRTCGATSGRGAYRSALQADRWVEEARSQLARLIGAASGLDIALCHSGTHALNAALYGVLSSGDHVITTGLDHNSLLRPLKQMELEGHIQLSIVESDIHGRASAQSAAAQVRSNTRLVAVGHASNVVGTVQELGPWRQLASACEALLMIDASQTLGYIPINVQQQGIDILAAAGHKGLRGLSGTGLLYIQAAARQRFRPLMLGGTGRHSEHLSVEPAWPTSVEVGNLNMPGIVSMAVAAQEVNSGPGLHLRCWLAVYQELVQQLNALQEVRVIGSQSHIDWQTRIPVVSIQPDHWDVHDLASVLDTSFGIEARAGYHCAALVHGPLGTATRGGTLRLSPGHSTTPEEIEYAVDALKQILGQV
jgi:selenocysteine lyase/cysteine desulfurase